MRQTYASERIPERLRDLDPYSFLSVFLHFMPGRAIIFECKKKDALTCRTAFLCALKCHAPPCSLPFSSCYVEFSPNNCGSEGTLICGDLDHSIWMHIILNTLHPSLTSWYLPPPPSSSQSWHCISEKEVQISFRLQGSAKWLHLCQAPYAIAAYFLWVTFL